MALDNYANLKASIEQWSHREDVKAIVDDFILLAESAMYSNPDASLRIRDMEQTATASTIITDDFVALPTGYLDFRRVSITVNDVEYPLEYKTPEQMNIDTTRSGIPQYFTIIDKIYFELLPDDVYTINMDYYGKLTALSASNTTNAILTNYPGIYLYGALTALEQWAASPENEALNYNRFIKTISGANKTSNKGRFSPRPVQRLRSATP